MKKIEWIKLNVDMFSNPKIRHIRKLPGGNELVLFWVMLLTKAGASNRGGYIMLTDTFPYDPEMLADEFSIDLQTVRFALTAFQKLNMISIDNGCIAVLGWEEHQAIDSLEKVREKGKLRQKKFREKQKKLLLKSNNNVKVEDSNVTVTLRNGIEVETEVEEEVYKEVYIHITEYEKVLERHLKNKDSKYNYLLNYLIKNKVCLSVLEEKIKVVNQIKNCKSKAGALITAIREDWQPVSSKNSTDLKFNNFTAREYDYDDLEVKLLGWDKDE